MFRRLTIVTQFNVLYFLSRELSLLHENSALIGHRKDSKILSSGSHENHQPLSKSYINKDIFSIQMDLELSFLFFILDFMCYGILSEMSMTLYSACFLRMESGTLLDLMGHSLIESDQHISISFLLYLKVYVIHSGVLSDYPLSNCFLLYCLSVSPCFHSILKKTNCSVGS